MILVKILLGLIGLVILLMLIALINTMFIKENKDIATAKPVDLAVSKKYAKEFSEMIKVETLSYQKAIDNIEKFNELHDVMKKLFPNVFNKLEVKEFKGGSLLIKWVGKLHDKPMVLMAHQDVVPADSNDWKHQPFSGKIENDEIYGRGTLDTKSTLYAFFKAIEELLKADFVPEQDIYISSSTDEEISGFGAELAVEYFTKNNIKPYIVLDEGGAIVSGALPSVQRAMALIGVIEKGYVNVKFTAKSRGGHSSTPPKNSPVARLSAFVNNVEKHFPLKTKMIKEVADIFKTAAPSMKGVFKYLFGNLWLFKPLVSWMLPMTNPYGRALLSTTIAFTMTKGSDAANVIPDSAYVIANLRTHPIQNIEESVSVLKKIADKYDIETEIVESREASPISLTDNLAYKYLYECIKKVYPDVIVSPYVMLGGTDARFFSEITDSAYRFSPVRMNNVELNKIHGKDESIRITALTEAVEFYTEFIKNHK